MQGIAAWLPDYMEILHFKDLGATTSVVTNAVFLVLGECQIALPTYLWGISSLL